MRGLNLFQLILALLLSMVAAEDGYDGWLRYAPVSCDLHCQQALPSHVVLLNSTKGSPIETAGRELKAGFQSILSTNLTSRPFQCNSSASILVATLDEYRQRCRDINVPELDPDGFWLQSEGDTVRILGKDARGALYGAYEYLAMVAQRNFSRVAYATSPHAPIRWVNQWDNMDGSIERGYGGASIFFKDGTVVEDMAPVEQYARLLASIRINAIVVNNVNANATLLLPENMKGLSRIADACRPYGVQIGISLNFASPEALGGLNTYDPLDPGVIAWWQNITDSLYTYVPDMAGYLVKADSEGQPGPDTYNRTLSQGANLFARALQPYGGVLMYRAFVYDDNLNESDWKADRAKAAVEYFKDLDGQFEENVVIQIKYGPIDFQVREPTSPLFANLYHTNTAIELEVSQEYLGQQCHLVYLPPLWKTVLDFDLRVDHKPSMVRDIISGQRFNRTLGGWAAVVNVGTNRTWLGSHLAMSNLYAYGRLAWSPTDESEQILEDWTRLTFGQNHHVINTISDMSMTSWPAYENYTGNLGIQTLTDILYTHYGPNPATQDNNGWGQWTRADHDSVGMDRTIWNGTGYTGQYPEEVAHVYESLESTPDDLVLWFHHVPWTHRLHSGVTVIQHFYNAHYAGAEAAHGFVRQWESLEGLIDRERYEAMRSRLVYQAGHSIVWRDAINNFYYNMTGIPDVAGRVGHHPWRIEAESMGLDGYQTYTVSPFEAASNTTAIITTSNSTTGTARTSIKAPSGVYDIGVNYYDLYGGQSKWTLSVGDKVVGQWLGDMEHNSLGHTPSIYLDGHSATRITFHGVGIRQGDQLKIVGEANGVEPAPLDYIVLLPPGLVD
ncbi:CAZyme family GH67 [Aspergillus niger]|nr:CAZyme family GH67 [Aspergillus niger]